MTTRGRWWNSIGTSGLLAGLTALLLIWTLSGKSYAESLFNLTVSSEGTTYNQGFDSVQNLLDAISVDSIQNHIPAYTEHSQVNIEMGYRGLPILVDIGTAMDPTAVHIYIPSIGVDKVFTGATRQESIDAMEDWLEGNGSSTLAEMTRYLAAKTPTDPIAGNPSSLMGTMTTADFNTGFTDQVTTLDQGVEAPVLGPGEKAENANVIALEASVRRLKAGDFEGSLYRVPLSYSFVSNDDPRRRIKVSVPLSVLITNGATSYTGGLGLAVSLPVTRAWVLTPAASYAVAAAPDFGTGAQLFSASLTSALSLPVGSFTINVGNMLGYYQSLPFHYKDYSYDPALKNFAIRNGLMIGFPLGKLLGGEVFVTDTRYLGSDLYVDQYNEVGFSLGLRKITDKKKGNRVIRALQMIRVGGTFVFGRDYQSWEFNAGYAF